MRRRSLPRRLLRAGLVLIAAVAVLIGGTIGTIELGCAGDAEPHGQPHTQPHAQSQRDPAVAARVALDLPGYHRPEIVSFLSYPEWSIVHAYEDFAAVLVKGDESDFGYRASISGFWRSLYQLNRLTAQYPGSYRDTKLMLYTIGFSFTAELAAKGVYENTLGRLFEALRGERKTAVDRFVGNVAEEYAAFLQQTPWYEFAFGRGIAALWRVPLASEDSALRHWERKLAMTVEFGVKAVYAKLIAAAAGSLGPVDRTTQAVVAAPSTAALEALAKTSDVALLRRLDDNTALIRAPRYRAFTQFLLRAIASDVRPLEVAGNTRALVTVIVPAVSVPPVNIAVAMFEVPLSARPGHRRLGLDLRVHALPSLLRWVQDTPGAQFEHFYDY